MCQKKFRKLSIITFHATVNRKAHKEKMKCLIFAVLVVVALMVENSGKCELSLLLNCSEDGWLVGTPPRGVWLMIGLCH